VEGQFPDVIAEWGNVSLRYDVKVCPGRLRRLRCAGMLLEWIPRTSEEGRRAILFGYFALLVVQPVDLAGTDLPLVSQNGFKLGLGQAWRQSAQYELQAWLRSFGTAGSGWRGSLVQHCDGKHAVDTGRGCHCCSVSVGVGPSGHEGHAVRGAIEVECWVSEVGRWRREGR
jgi:hypothetical protein